MQIKPYFLFSLIFHILILAFIVTYKSPIKNTSPELQAELWEESAFLEVNTKNKETSIKSVKANSTQKNISSANISAPVKLSLSTKNNKINSQEAIKHKEVITKTNLSSTKQKAEINLKSHKEKIKYNKFIDNRPAIDKAIKKTNPLSLPIAKQKVVKQIQNLEPDNKTNPKVDSIKNTLENKNHIKKSREENLARLLESSNNDNVKLDSNSKQEIKKSVQKTSSNINTNSLSSGYINKIQNIVKRNINYHGENANASVKVRIDAMGVILSKKIIKSSGNSMFDKSVLEALENSDPLPIPENGQGIDINLHFSPY